MDTLLVSDEDVLLLFLDLLGEAVVVLDEQPDNSIPAIAITETPVLSLFIVLFIHFSPFFY
jgi:hypothetical protein